VVIDGVGIVSKYRSQFISSIRAASWAGQIDEAAGGRRQGLRTFSDAVTFPWPLIVQF
jgi:hypothetical protein